MASKEVIRPPFKSDVNPVITEAGFIFFQQVAQWINTLLTPPEWIAPTFQNSWVNYGSGWNTAAYCKDGMGFVHLRGLVKDGTDETVIFTLPVGYRPSHQELFSTISNGAIGRVDVKSNGEVTAWGPSDPAWISLDGITFYAG